MDDKEKRIQKEIKRLNKIFEDVSENKKGAVARLIDNVAFMSVTLEDLKDEINANGVKELYLNGANQHGFKETIEVKTYNAMIKNYVNAVKQLNTVLPVDKKIDEADEFDKFCDKS